MAHVLFALQQVYGHCSCFALLSTCMQEVCTPHLDTYQHRSLSRIGSGLVQPDTRLRIRLGLPGNFFHYHFSPIWQFPWFTFQLLRLFIVAATVTREQLVTFIGSTERKTVAVASWKLSIGFIIRRNQWCCFWTGALGIDCKQWYRNKLCPVLRPSLFLCYVVSDVNDNLYMYRYVGFYGEHQELSTAVSDGPQELSWGCWPKRYLEGKVDLMPSSL